MTSEDIPMTITMTTTMTRRTPRLRVAVLALRLPRLLPHVLPRMEIPDGAGGPDHGAASARRAVAAPAIMPAAPS